MKGLAIVIGKKPPKKMGGAMESDESEKDMEDSFGESDEAREASDLAFDALKSGDKDAFYEALMSFHSACGAE